MTWKKGGCHCGAVAFEVLAPDEIEVVRLQLLDLQYERLSAPDRAEVALPVDGRQGQDQRIRSSTLSTAKHLFCSICGVKSFYVPRSHPDGYSVNFRALNPKDFAAVKITSFDGTPLGKRAETCAARKAPDAHANPHAGAFAHHGGGQARQMARQGRRRGQVRRHSGRNRNRQGDDGIRSGRRRQASAKFWCPKAPKA